jgi:hypothetical protein
MLRLLFPLLLVGVVVAVIVRLVKGSRRKADTTPELHEHPERLDQMLDPTDDA